MKKYSYEELTKLKKNTYIVDVKYDREIHYEPVFKLWTVFMRLSHPELPAKEIFEIAGIDTSILNNDLPRRNIHNWCEMYIEYGREYFLNKMNYTIYNPFFYELSKNILSEIKKYDEKIEFIKEARKNGLPTYFTYI